MARLTLAGAILFMLGCMEPNEESLIRDLIGDFEKQGHVAGVAMQELEQIGEPAVPFLAEALQHPDDYTRAAAATTLSRICPHAQSAVPRLIIASRDRNQFVRMRSLMALGNCRATSLAAQRAYSDALEDPYSEVQALGALGVGLIGVSNPAILERLGEMQQHSDSSLAQIATKIIGDLEPPSARAVELLVAACNHEYEPVRLAAVQGLGKQGSLAEVAVPTLITALKDQRWPVRASSALVLGDLGIAANDACPALRRTQRDEVSEVRQAAAIGRRKACKG